MAISEDRRHALHTRLEVVLGPDEATTLMAERMDLRFEGFEHQMQAGFSDLRAELSDKLAHHTRALSVAMVGQSAVVAGVIFAAAAFWG